ncbi:MAG: HD domain-containing protein [Elusimicrobiales bacterium]|nr:HD domain-containing protein [Elusimicrobiales bacterium]
MRFSDLNKPRSEPAAEPKKPARAAPAPAAEKPAPAPEAAEAVEPLPQRPAPAPEHSERAEAVKKHAAAYTLASREPRGAPPEPQRPFRELDAQAKEVYGRVLTQAGELLSAINQPYTEKYEAILQTCGLAAEVLKTNNVLLNYTRYSSAEDYLRAHTANTTIIALAMGTALNLDHQELRLLGFCAMAHDIGMTEYSDLYTRETRLTEEEFAAITLHTESGVAKLDRIVDLDYKIKDRAKRIIFQTHERIDGSGYPDRLSSEAIDPLAQLIGIADVYEAMTHPRAWREPLDSPDVIKELIEKEGRGFTAKTVKALISAVSIYPPGSIVLLSTGEIGRVLKVNRGSLTRPLVETLLDPDFAQINPEIVDLLEHPLTSIERPVAMSELRARNPKFAIKVELGRWWTDW